MIRLSDYIADLINDNEKSVKVSDDKIERLESSIKMLEEQHKLVVSDKFNATKKLSVAKVNGEHFQRELELLKQKNEKQEITINDLKREIDAFNEEKKRISENFKLFRSQEKVHDEAVSSLKRKFEEGITEFLNKDASTKDDLDDPRADHGEIQNDQASHTVASTIRLCESFVQRRNQVSSHKKLYRFFTFFWHKIHLNCSFLFVTQIE